MAQVLAYKCIRCNKLYEDKAKYIKHLKKEAKDRYIHRKINYEVNMLKEEFDKIRNTVGSIDELRDVIFTNQNLFWAAAALKYPYYFKDSVPVLERFERFQLQWSNRVSNTHSCPLHGVENFTGEPNKPISYPGWQGSIGWISKNGRGHDLLSNGRITGIFTGNGGGGGDSSRYEVRLYAADWPKMFENEMKRQYIDRENDNRARNWKLLGGRGDQVSKITEVDENFKLPNPYTFQFD